MTEAFTRRDWGLLVAVAAMWGSSFLLIEIGLVHLAPASVAWLRIVFGAITLGCLPGARRGVRRADLPGIALLGLVWMAVPFLLFAFAQRSIDSSLAGMINGAAPLFTVAVGAVWARRLPRGAQLAGLGVGFVGVLAINGPAVRGADATALGAGMVLLATLFYGFAFNLTVPLEERSGVLPVIWRAQLVAAVLLAPLGVAGLARSTPSWSSLAAVAALGAFSTGLGFAAFTTLASRVGAARGSVAVYFIPVVAIVLGVLLRDEAVAAASLAGTALVLLGAYLTSRRSAHA